MSWSTPSIGSAEVSPRGRTRTPRTRQHARVRSSTNHSRTFLRTLALAAATILLFLALNANANPTPELGGATFSLDRHRMLRERAIVTITVRKTTTTHTTIVVKTKQSSSTADVSTSQSTSSPSPPSIPYSPTVTSSTGQTSQTSSTQPSSTETTTQKPFPSSSIGRQAKPTTRSTSSASDSGRTATSSSPSRPALTLSSGAIAGILTGGVAMVLGLASVACVIRQRRRIGRLATEEAAPRPAELHPSTNPYPAPPLPAKLPSSNKAVMTQLRDSIIGYPPLSPISFVTKQSDSISLRTARGTLLSMTLDPPYGPTTSGSSPSSESWRLRPLPPVPKKEKRKSPLSTATATIARPALSITPFLTRALRRPPQAQLQGTPSSGSPVVSSSSGARSATNMSRQGRSPRVASDGGIRLAGGPPGPTLEIGEAEGLPPPYRGR